MAVPFEFALFASLALALGFKHSFDADHLVAVSNLLTRQPRLERAVGLAATWAGGHLVTAAIVSSLVYVFAENLLPLTSRFELLVPLMLLAIGLVGILAEARRLHYHRHAHAEGGAQHGHLHFHVRTQRHDHGAMAGIGVVHGLASNDELLVVLLVGLGADSWWQVMAGVGVFSAGVVAGMILYAAGIHAASKPLSRRFGWNWLPSALTVLLSVASIAYGVYLLVGGQGWNLFGDRLGT